jgi:integrase
MTRPTRTPAARRNGKSHNPTTWLDTLGEVPPRLKKRLSDFTLHRDGFVRKYKDRTVFVCSRGKFLAAFEAGGWTGAAEAVEAFWADKQGEIDATDLSDLAELRTTGGLKFVELAALFYADLDHRVEKGKPKRLSQTTAWDYKRTINELGGIIGPEKYINELAPADFGKYADAIAENAASSFARKVAYLEAFLRWALLHGYLSNNRSVRGVAPGMDVYRSLVGPRLVKPSAEDLRDERVAEARAFEPAEIAKLWHVATDLERLWIGLGLTGALDNADIMQMTRSLVVPGGVAVKMSHPRVKRFLDYRRRKRGKIRRVIPLIKPVDRLLQAYVRPDPAVGVDEDLFFLQPDGTPLRKFSESGPQNHLTRTFIRLMIRAGLRSKPVVTKLKDGRRQVKSAGSGDRRGFRSLRTSFANLAPSGYRDEVEIIMGHGHGGVLLDRYLETHGFSRLYELVSGVWVAAFSERPDESWKAEHPRPAQASDPAERNASPAPSAVSAAKD